MDTEEAVCVTDGLNFVKYLSLGVKYIHISIFKKKIKHSSF